MGESIIEKIDTEVKIREEIDRRLTEYKQQIEQQYQDLLREKEKEYQKLLQKEKREFFHGNEVWYKRVLSLNGLANRNDTDACLKRLKGIIPDTFFIGKHDR